MKYRSSAVIHVWRNFSFKKRKFSEQYMFFAGQNSYELKLSQFELFSKTPVKVGYDRWEGCSLISNNSNIINDFLSDDVREWAEDPTNLPPQAMWTKISQVEIPDDVYEEIRGKLHCMKNYV